jgi:hypothetical protein
MNYNCNKKRVIEVPFPSSLDFGMLDGLLQDFEDEVDVVLGGVDAHQADAPDLAGRWTEAAGDLQHVSGKEETLIFSTGI